MNPTPASQALTRRTVLGVGVAVAVLFGTTGCGVTGGEGDASDGSIANLQLLVPNDPGGGYDVTGRTALQIMDETGIVGATEVTNLPGAGGTVGLARTVNEAGNADFLMVMGLGVVGAAYTNETDAAIGDATPIARLIEEAGAIFVPASSPYQDMDDLVTAWKADPAAFPVGGGSSPGGPDHLLPMQLAAAVGIDPTEVNFVSYAGGGELLPAVLGGQLAFAASGYPEFLDQVESGDLRILAVTSAERVPVVDAPTLQEQGIDLEFTNWRGLLAPPELTDEQTTRLIDAVTEMQGTDEWQQALETNGWTDAFLAGDEYAQFLTEQDERVRGVLDELGLL
ncbi:Bug family tripartite tricarboxylate transporter substrate binding protein [Clavibacter michiganensis]|uniref:Bug family tripartite tricarboxylate transporter substrate binding protein n=1 Tax=Clavibacter michiganensis TaxID=28447 RepID=UPI003EB9D72E